MGAAENVSRLLIEKRCEVYSTVAALLMDVEEALDNDDGLRTRYLLKDVRRSLRSALAFLAPTEVGTTQIGSVSQVGEALFTRYLLPFELASLLLTVALIGTVFLAKRKI